MKTKWLMNLIIAVLIAMLTIACDSSSDSDDGNGGSGSVPANAPVAIAFTDTDVHGASQIAGDVIITKAAGEGDVTHYVLYWGSDTTTKQTAITTIAKTGSDLTYTFAADTSLPSGATHLLAYTKNATGEMTTGVSQEITDKTAPVNAAQSVSFTDTDLVGTGDVSGDVTITAASDESDITHYVLYWGDSTTDKQNTTPIADVSADGSNETYTFPENTSIPATATHLLVFTKNDDGEMLTGVNVTIDDKLAPVNEAQSVSFTDTDLVGTGDVSGDVTITKASDESDITHYVLYWGDSTADKQSTTAITELAKDGGNQTHTFAENTSIPATATHLLVFTKNDDGEMTTGVNVAIDDKLSPVNAAQGISFTDTDLDSTGDVSGDVIITKAGNEGDITHYVLYWGDSSTDKLNTTQIAELAKDGNNQTYTFAENTDIPTTPTTATHLLVFTKNDDGEMETGVAVEINDKMAPVNAAQSVSFTDTDLVDVGDVSGDITITAAVDESDLTHYVIYWGDSSTDKLSTTAIADVSTDSGNSVTYTLSENTDMTTATHLLVFTKNADGEMATGVSMVIDDKVAPANAADSIDFSDTDWITAGQIGGDVTIDVANDESDITHYALYWGESTSDKLSETGIVNITADTSNKTYTFDASTDIPSGATHFLLFSNNADGEMPTGVNVLINDIYRKLPDTGQDTSSGTAGEDSDYTINAPSFTDNSDDTITDNNTLLMWQKYDHLPVSWSDADASCDATTDGEYTDWRLPTPNELVTIIDAGNLQPAIDSTMFPDTDSSPYWTSVAYANGSGNAWTVDFGAGIYLYYVNKLNNGGVYSRCVRNIDSTTDIWSYDYTDNSGDTTSHGATGLMWQQDASSDMKTWENAIADCKGLSLGGHEDWRLPNAAELLSIVNFDNYQPSIDSTYFPGTENGEYWSSTWAQEGNSMAYYVNFTDGETDLDLKTSSYYVRCVRGGL